MERYSEDLLQYLIEDKTERDNWYKARYYVMNTLPSLEGEGISYDSNKRMHVVVNWEDSSSLLLAVIRQICLVAHYPNYQEDTGVNRTLISICTKDITAAYQSIRGCAYLGNLLAYCKCNITDSKEAECTETLPLDIEFEFVTGKSEIGENDIAFEVNKKDVEDKTAHLQEDDYILDVTMGMLVCMVYNTGVEIDNLSAYDNANIERYSIALNVFCYKLKPDLIFQKWKECANPNNNGKYNQVDIKNKLSSVFCADCFESRIRGLLDTSEKNIVEYLLQDFGTVMKVICKENIITSLARCEHSRWNVEKLIMGFSPLKPEDWYKIESCFGKERRNLIKRLKKAGRHIDICSYRGLRRVNPEDMKYDFFLILAMPQIMRSYYLAK